MKVKISIIESGCRIAQKMPSTDCLYLTLMRWMLSVKSRSLYCLSFARSLIRFDPESEGGLSTDIRRGSLRCCNVVRVELEDPLAEITRIYLNLIFPADISSDSVNKHFFNSSARPRTCGSCKNVKCSPGTVCNSTPPRARLLQPSSRSR